MNLFISADMEGIAGSVSPEQLTPAGFEYEAAREIMTREILAAIEGARSAGCEEVVVSDSHGNGQNIILSMLPRDVLLVRSWPRPLGMMQGIETKPFRCAFLLGYHVGGGQIEGGLAHTMNSRALLELKIDGEPASELTISAALAGQFGASISLVSGDSQLGECVRMELPNTSFVTTKWSYGLFSALCRHPDALVDEIKERSAMAFARANEISKFKLRNGMRAQLRMKSRLAAEYAAMLPGVERTGSTTFEFNAADVIDLSRRLAFFLNYRTDLH